MQATLRPAVTQQPLQLRTHRRCNQGCSNTSTRVAALPGALAEQLQGSGTATPLVSRSTRKQLLKAIKHSHRSLGCRTEAAAATAAVNTLVQDLQRLSIQLHQASATEPCKVVEAPSHSTRMLPSVGRLSSSSAASASVPVPVVDWEEELHPVYEARAYQVSGRVLVCQGSKCRAKGALDVLRAVSGTSAGSDVVQVLPCKCLGLCKQGPAMRVKVDGAPKCAAYTRVEPEQVPELLDVHFGIEVQSAAPASPSATCCTDCKQET